LVSWATKASWQAYPWRWNVTELNDSEREAVSGYFCLLRKLGVMSEDEY